MKSVIVTGDLKSCHSVVVISAYCFICRWIDIVHLSNSANGTIAWLELENAECKCQLAIIEEKVAKRSFGP